MIHDILFTDASRTLPPDLTGPPLDLGFIRPACNGEPHLGFVVGHGMRAAGILDGDLAVVDPCGPFRGGDLVAASVDGVTLLRRLTIIRSIPHLLNEDGGRPQLTLALDTPLLGIVRSILRLQCTTPPTAPRARVEYSRDGALLRFPDPLFPLIVRPPAAENLRLRESPPAGKRQRPKRRRAIS